MRSGNYMCIPVFRCVPVFLWTGSRWSKILCTFYSRGYAYNYHANKLNNAAYCPHVLQATWQDCLSESNIRTEHITQAITETFSQIFSLKMNCCCCCCISIYAIILLAMNSMCFFIFLVSVVLLFNSMCFHS